MKIIQEPKETIAKLIKPAIDAKPPFRMYTYCESRTAKNGTLIFHFVSGEVVFLESTDFLSGVPVSPPALSLLTPSCAAYLLSHRFFVNEQEDDTLGVEKIRDGLRLLSRVQFNGFQDFVILTTTDCNARCYYCYEKGMQKIHMDDKTARDVADYIIQNSRQADGKKVRLSWFGGEPLYNSRVIDTICGRLSEAGLEYQSSMLSNGLLMDEKMLDRAVNIWKLNSIQITIDGTESVYNKTKAYIDCVGSAYETVLANIAALLKMDVLTTIRLNVDESNVDDLDRLADELAERFQSQKLIVYPHTLFHYNADGLEEQRHNLEAKCLCLRDKLRTLGFSGEEGADASESFGIRTHFCMADHPDGVVILPDGTLHSCEHITANHTWGSIYTGETKLDLCHPAASGEGMTSPIRYWSEYITRPECRNCPAYPFCLTLKHCPSATPECDGLILSHFKNELERQMAKFAAAAEASE